jgi:hypothetical protein
MVVDAHQDHVLRLHVAPWAKVEGDVIRQRKNYMRFWK